MRTASREKHQGRPPPPRPHSARKSGGGGVAVEGGRQRTEVGRRAANALRVGGYGIRQEEEVRSARAVCVCVRVCVYARARVCARGVKVGRIEE